MKEKIKAKIDQIIKQAYSYAQNDVPVSKADFIWQLDIRAYKNEYGVTTVQLDKIYLSRSNWFSKYSIEISGSVIDLPQSELKELFEHAYKQVTQFVYTQENNGVEKYLNSGLEA